MEEEIRIPQEISPGKKNTGINSPHKRRKSPGLLVNGPEDDLLVQGECLLMMSW